MARFLGRVPGARPGAARPCRPMLPPQFQARVPESGPFPAAISSGKEGPPKTHLGEALAPLSKAYQRPGRSAFPRRAGRRPPSWAALRRGSAFWQGLAGRSRAAAGEEPPGRRRRRKSGWPTSPLTCCSSICCRAGLWHAAWGRGLQEEEAG